MAVKWITRFLYLAIDRLPLGVAVTIEMLGPLALIVLSVRTISSWIWAAVALVGVALLSGLDANALYPIGVAFALAAGAIWTFYILMSARAGKCFRKQTASPSP